MKLFYAVRALRTIMDDLSGKDRQSGIYLDRCRYYICDSDICQRSGDPIIIQSVFQTTEGL